MTDLVVLLGHHIGYSASPAMHNAAFASLGINARYELADVAGEDLAGAVSTLRAVGRIGANVTQPHKLAVCDLVDERAPEVLRLGAANTIVSHNGQLVAHNTDLPAVGGELASIGPVRSAVVLGTGGASRAVQAALTDSGTTFEVVGRARWGDLARLLGGADLVVNATPIGTASGDSPIAADLLRPDLSVLDLVYRPSPTRLVRDARRVGAVARGGAVILLAQAAHSFALWTGRAAPVDVMREALLGELGATADA
jgi:shikimate dehydrogenase